MVVTLSVEGPSANDPTTPLNVLLAAENAWVNTQGITAVALYEGAAGVGPAGVGPGTPMPARLLLQAPRAVAGSTGVQLLVNVTVPQAPAAAQFIASSPLPLADQGACGGGGAKVWGRP